MRDLSANAECEMTIRDARTNSEVVFYYRNPAPKEQAAFEINQIKKKGKRVVVNVFKARLEYGLLIITGIRDGDFGFDGKPISSNPESPDYRPDWKDLIKKGAADLITLFAYIVYNGSRVENKDEGAAIAAGTDFDEDEETAGEGEPAGEEDYEEEEEVPPLEKSSADS